jgi:hypothetical protein
VSDQATDALLPALVELAPAPNVATLVAVLVLEVIDPEQAVPGELTVQV